LEHDFSILGQKREAARATSEGLQHLDNLCHFVLEFGIPPKYSGTQIMARDSHTNRLTSEDTEYNLSVH